MHAKQNRILARGVNLLIILVLALSMAGIQTVFAATLCVEPTGAGTCSTTIQAAIDAASPGDTINVASGTYTEVGQIVISKNLTMIGADKTTTILKPGQNTGTSGDARTWILVNAGVEFNLSNVTLDGSGMQVETAFLSHGTGVFENNIVQNMYYSKYVGRGVALYGGNMTIRNNSFSNIQRIGMYAALAGTTNAVFDGNTYVGKGPGDWLDYGIEIEAGAHAEVMNNTITDSVGVALSDGSTSAGLYLSTYFAPGTSMNAHDNTLMNNTAGIAVGYWPTDTSTTIAHHNKFIGNQLGIDTTGAAVNATENWWGSASPDWSTTVSANVLYAPWCTNEGCTTFANLPVHNTTQNTYYATIQAAINAANAGDTINVTAGTYVLNGVLNLDKAGLTLHGVGSPLIKVSGIGDRFDISATGVTLDGLRIEKTDNLTEQNIIRIRASNTSITNNEIFGHYVFGDAGNTRAMVINAGAFSGLNISGNTIHHLRQPAYISGTHTGTISTNYVYYTRGWVLEGGNLTFTNNTWGSGADANVFDIAIIPMMPASYYTDVIGMSNANNGAFIEDQRTTPFTLSTVYVDGSVGASGTGTATSPKKTISEGVARVVSGGTIHVAAGTYDEDVNVNKSVSLVGAGAGSTTIRGLIGGNGATISVSASNVTIAGFTITRLGNNLTEWNNAGLNSAGIAMQGVALTAANIHDNIISGNRTGIDINNSSGHTIQNNVITDNRTGLLFRNQTDNLTVTGNDITNNWTVGVLFLDASGGTNSPVQTALNSTFSNNNISGNWYGQVVDRQTGGSLPLPGTTNMKNFSPNWWGTVNPVVSILNSAEPGYTVQIPVAYGGTATAPGGQPDILGTASANIQYTPWLCSGTDTSAALGFQPTSQTDCSAPVVTGVSVSPAPVYLNTLVTLTAVANDSGTGNANIASAEYNLNNSAWQSMTATDGNFDSAVENVNANFTAATFGSNQVCVRATDMWGNTGSTSCTTFMVGYKFIGFSQPIDMGALNSAKAGQTIPVKWRLTDANGLPISDPGSFAGLVTQSGSCAASLPTDAIETYSAGSGLQYLGDGYWQYNWKTLKSYAGCRTMYVQFAGGLTSPTVTFQFK